MGRRGGGTEGVREVLTMGDMHMKRQGIQPTNEKPPDTYLWDKIKKNVAFCTTVDSSTTKKGNFYSDLYRRLPTTSRREGKYIYVMHVYGCNSILTTSIKNISDN